MERKLASIQRILKIEDIPNADKIQKATVLGWALVVQKGEFEPGDLCVYCEVDSILPEKPEFEFLKDKKYRIKTVKLRGQISQGICFPLSILPNLIINKVSPEGLDVTELLGVKKWEPEIPANLRGQIAGPFPSFIPKTDEIRLQSIPDILDELRGKEVYYSLKINGTSSTFFVKDEKFGVCSRNLEMKDDGLNAYWEVAKTYEIESKLRSVGKNIAIQGELAGPGIQKNKLGLKKLTLFVFNVWDIDKYNYLGFYEFQKFVNDIGLQAVPIIQIARAEGQDWTLEALLEFAKGKYESGKEREGIVIRTTEETHSQVLKGRASFKVLNNNDLLKEE
jgi:RNA ligase (TIGR02306 family)